MYPNPSDPFSSETGGWFLGLIAGGFMLAYGLRKLGFLASVDAQTRFFGVLAVGIAAGVALFSDGTSPHGWIDWAGRVALFLIVLFAVGIPLGIGGALGIEKAEKEKD